jgi:hypothetical protein
MEQVLPQSFVFGVFQALRRLEQTEAGEGGKSQKPSANEQYQNVSRCHEWIPLLPWPRATATCFPRLGVPQEGEPVTWDVR